MTPSHVVMFSGGIASWAAAERTVARHGAAGTVLLFCDTLIEDADLYRFLDEAAAHVGAELVKIAEGRDPWQVFRDSKFLGNSRIDPCSRILKRELAATWLSGHAPGATIVIGYDWSEAHRLPATVRRYKALGHRVEAPLTEKPYLTRTEMFAELKRIGIAAPRLYAAGFSHNNCGGFCVKAGQGHFATLLKTLPDLYAYHEAQEQEFRQFIGRNVSILSDTNTGVKHPLTLRTLRERIQAGRQIDLFDIGGCDCMGDPADSE